MAAATRARFDPGWTWKDDKLYLFSLDEVVVLRAWPRIAAWRATPSERPRGHRPTGALLARVRHAAAASPERRAVGAVLQAFREQDLILPWPGLEAALLAWLRSIPEDTPAALAPALPDELGPPALGERLLRVRGGLRARRRAARAFAGTIPREVFDAVAALPSRHYHALALLARSAPALELLRDAPALLAALGSPWVFRGWLRDPLRAALRQVPRRRHHIAGWLGLPPTRSVARVLTRIPARAADVRMLSYLAPALRLPELPPPLLHLPVLDRGVLRILTDPPLRAVATHALLEEIAAHPRHSRLEELAYALADTLLLWHQARPGRPAPALRSIAALTALHDALVEEVGRLGPCLSLVFPEPPTPGAPGIEPILTAEALHREGLEQHHCVSGYAALVAGHQRFVYRVTAPERATLSLRPDHRGGWVVDQLKGCANAPVSPETWEAVHTWLRARGQGRSAEPDAHAAP